MIYLIAILAYLLVLTGIGVYKSRQVKTQADFSVAGRSLSPWILVCTMLAAWIGTGSIVGNAGMTYETGLAAVILPIGSVIGMMLLTRVAPRARSYEVYSVPEIIGSRYGQTARAAGRAGPGDCVHGHRQLPVQCARGRAQRDLRRFPCVPAAGDHHRRHRGCHLHNSRRAAESRLHGHCHRHHHHDYADHRVACPVDQGGRLERHGGSLRGHGQAGAHDSSGASSLPPRSSTTRCRSFC